MPRFEFKDDDKFVNYTVTNPKFIVDFYLNNAYINSTQPEDRSFSGPSQSIFDLYVNSTYLSAPYVSVPSLGKGYVQLANSVAGAPNSSSQKDIEDLDFSLPLKTTIARNVLVKEYFSSSLEDATNRFETPGIPGVMEARSAFKIISLRNTIDWYKTYSPKFDYGNFVSYDNNTAQAYMNNNGGYGNTIEMVPDYINLIQIPNLFYGRKIKPTSVKLRFYYTGSLLAEASDIYGDGVLYETTGSNTGADLGIILYSEGAILITGSYNLHSLTDGYLSPSTSGAKNESLFPSASYIATSSWAHFAAYQSFVTSSTDPSSSYGPTSSSYQLEFEGVHEIPSLLCFAHAKKNELNWSNNRTFLKKDTLPSTDSYKDSYVSVTSSNSFIENKGIQIKNTISSSFSNNSASYEPQTFITTISLYDADGDIVGVAKLANPIKKTPERDYTFKLKLDL